MKLKRAAIHGKGVPDFLLQNQKNKNDYRFVEIKFTQAALSKEQEDWTNKYGYNLFIARLAPITGKDWKDLRDEEICKINKMRRS